MFTDGYLASHKFVTELSTNQSFTLSKKLGIKAELNANYRSPIYQGLLYVRKTSDVSIGFSKSVLKKQGTIKLALFIRQIKALLSRIHHSQMKCCFQFVNDAGVCPSDEHVIISTISTAITHSLNGAVSRQHNEQHHTLIRVSTSRLTMIPLMSFMLIINYISKVRVKNRYR